MDRIPKVALAGRVWLVIAPDGEVLSEHARHADAIEAAEAVQAVIDAGRDKRPEIRTDGEGPARMERFG